MNWENIGPVQDRKLGRALVNFGKMIDDGRALGWPAGQPIQPIMPQVEPRYRESDFPAHDDPTARKSIQRATSQYLKGRMSAIELSKITARCNKFLAIQPQDNS